MYALQVEENLQNRFTKKKIILNKQIYFFKLYKARYLHNKVI